LLLDALVNSTPFLLLSPSQTVITGQGFKNRKNMQTIEQHQGKANALMTQDLVQDMPNPVNVGRYMYEEGDEDDMLQQCQAEATQKGDLSPMHSEKSKKSHTRKKSWDDRVNEEANVRRLPMRVAKQKVVASTTSTRSNRSKKK